MGKMPGGGQDAPDPFAAAAAVRPAYVPPAASVAPPAVVPAAPMPAQITQPAAEGSPLPPPAFRQPVAPRRGRRVLIIVVGSLIVLMLLASVGLVAWKFYLGEGTSNPGPTPSVSIPTPIPVVSPVSSEVPSATPLGGGTPAPTAALDQVNDPDQDGLTNAEEGFYGTDSEKADTDGDGFKDGEEVRAGYNPVGEGKLDSDNDGFPDPDEREFGTDPFNPDTDGDGYKDGDEIKNGYNPLIPSPGDKL